MKHFPNMSYSVMVGDDYVDFDVQLFDGRCILTMPACPDFGGDESAPYRSPIIKSPTWGDVFLHAMKAQQKTLDFHHSYLEGVEHVCDDAGVKILRFKLGS